MTATPPTQREALEQTLRELGLTHTGVAESVAGGLIAAGWVQWDEAKADDGALTAAIKSLGEWSEPFTAERESGVAVDADISQEAADWFNAEAKKDLARRIGAYFSALRALPLTPPKGTEP